MSDEMTWLQREEQLAMTLNRTAVTQVISSLRRYREEVQKLLSKRYRDGEVDGATLSMFESTIAEIEEGGP